MKDLNKKPLRVLFYGGSITCGEGAPSYEESWAGRTTKALAQLYPDRLPEVVNASVSGTGSFLGACRLKEQVLSHFIPDLVFAEFAVNDCSDAEKFPERVTASMESILLQLTEANPKVAVVYIYTVQKSRRTGADIHHLLAKAWGVREIDLRNTVYPAWDLGLYRPEDVLQDGVHPNALGHALYAEAVRRAIEKAPKAFLKPVKAPKALLAVNPLSDPHMCFTDKIEALQGFVLKEVADDTHIKQLDRLVVHKALVAEGPGACCEIAFEGRYFALFHRIGRDCGRLEAVLDGGAPMTAEMFYGYDSLYEEQGEFLSFFRLSGLDPGPHRIRFTLLPESDPNSSGTRCEIAGFFAG